MLAYVVPFFPEECSFHGCSMTPSSPITIIIKTYMHTTWSRLRARDVVKAIVTINFLICWLDEPLISNDTCDMINNCRRLVVYDFNLANIVWALQSQLLSSLKSIGNRFDGDDTLPRVLKLNTMKPRASMTSLSLVVKPLHRKRRITSRQKPARNAGLMNILKEHILAFVIRELEFEYFTMRLCLLCILASSVAIPAYQHFLLMKTDPSLHHASWRSSHVKA